VTRESSPADARVRLSESAQEHALAGAYPLPFRQPAIDGDRVADAPGHPRLHAVAEAGDELGAIIEPPILDDPEELAVDHWRLGLFDNEGARQAATHLHQAIGMRVIPEGTRIGRREAIGESFSWPDRWLRQPGHAVHGV